MPRVAAEAIWRRLLFVASASLLVAPDAFAADAPAAGPTVVQAVTVHPPAPKAEQEKRIHAFVGAVAQPVNQDGLVRWTRPICPLEAGLARDQGIYVIQRLSQVAKSVGAPVGPRHCEPNLFIAATTDPEKLARAWARHNRNYFKGRPAAVARFQQTDHPVRVWYNAEFSGAAGQGDSPAAGLSSGYSQAPTITFADDSRLVFNAPRGLSSVILIIDGRRLDGIRTAALADYVAMVGLTRMSPNTDPGDAPTILKLFDRPGPDGERPSGLTDWDRDFLRALYQADQRDVHQQGVIEAKVLGELAR